MSSRQLRQTRTSVKQFYPSVESLEDRMVPAVDFTLGGGTLTIFQVGNVDKNDTVSILDDGKGGLKVTANWKVAPGSQKDFTSLGPITNVVVNLKGGNDTLNYALTAEAKAADAKELTITANQGKGNDRFTADLGNFTLRANRTFAVDGKQGNDTFTITNVGNVGNAANPSATPPVVATTPTLKATLNGNQDKDTATVNVTGKIFGTVDIAWDGGGDTSGVLLNKKAIDNFTFTGNGNVASTTGSPGGAAGKLSVDSQRSNASITYTGEVDGKVSLTETGTTAKDTLSIRVTVNKDTNNIGGDVTGKISALAGKDDLTFIVINNASAANSPSPLVPTTITNAIADGGFGFDKGVITANFVSDVSIETLSKV